MMQLLTGRRNRLASNEHLYISNTKSQALHKGFSVLSGTYTFKIACQNVSIHAVFYKIVYFLLGTPGKPLPTATTN